MASDAHGNRQGKRLVVVGCGYVGGEVARQAAARGAAVTALTRNAAKARALEEHGIATVVADLATSDWHGRIPGGADFILNSVSSGGDPTYRRSYVEGMASLLAWAADSGRGGTLVYTGSTSVYPQDGGVVVDETATVGGGERVAALLETEAQVRASGGACARWFILRLAGIYGPGRHHLLDQVATGQVAGHGHHRLNLVHRDDIAAAIWACFQAPASVANEVFNVADDAPATKETVARWLAEQAGLAAPRFTGEPIRGRRAAPLDRSVSNRKIKTVLGWRPRFPSFREGYAGSSLSDLR